MSTVEKNIGVLRAAVRGNTIAPTSDDPKLKSIVEQAHTEHKQSLAKSISVTIGRHIKAIVLVAITIFLFVSIHLAETDQLSLSVKDPSSSKFTNAVYFWATTTSTVGYGDVLPCTSTAKWLTASYQIFIAAVSMGGVYHLARGVQKAKESIRRITPRK